MKKTIAIILFLFFSSHLYAATEYIDSGCANPGDGSSPDCVGTASTNPHDELADISWTKGNTYKIKRGTTYSEAFPTFDVNPQLESERVTITAYGDGDKPLIKGVVTLGTWTDTELNGEYSISEPSYDASLVNRDASQDTMVLLKNGIPINYGGTAGSLSAGYWVLDTGTIYYKPDDGMSHTFEAGCGVLFSERRRSYYTISKLEFYGGEIGIRSNNQNALVGSHRRILYNDIWGFEGGGIYLEGGDSDLIHGNKISHCYYSGVKLGRDAQGVYSIFSTVSNNTFDHICNYYSSDTGEGHAIDLAIDSDTNVIEYNTIRYSGYGGGVVGTDQRCGSSISLDNTRNNIVRGNYLHDNYRGSIGLGHVATKPNTTGALIYNNMFVRNGTLNDSADDNARENIGGIIIINHEEEDIDWNTKIYNNTFYGMIGDWSGSDYTANACIRVVSRQGNVSGIVIKNNILANNETFRDLIIQESDPHTVTALINNNVWFRSAGGDNIRYKGTDYDSTVGGEFTSYKTASGATNDINSNPLLRSNFSLKFGSSAIDLAELLSIHVAGWKDVAGNGRLCDDGPDAGAREECRANRLPILSVPISKSKTASWYVAAGGAGGHFLEIDGSENMLEIDGAGNKLRIDGVN
jgi:hypothetical protein